MDFEDILRNVCEPLGRLNTNYKLCQKSLKPLQDELRQMFDVKNSSDFRDSHYSDEYDSWQEFWNARNEKVQAKNEKLEELQRSKEDVRNLYVSLVKEQHGHYVHLFLFQNRNSRADDDVDFYTEQGTQITSDADFTRTLIVTSAREVPSLEELQSDKNFICRVENLVTGVFFAAGEHENKIVLIYETGNYFVISNAHGIKKVYLD